MCNCHLIFLKWITACYDETSNTAAAVSPTAFCSAYSIRRCPIGWQDVMAHVHAWSIKGMLHVHMQLPYIHSFEMTYKHTWIKVLLYVVTSWSMFLITCSSELMSETHIKVLSLLKLGWLYWRWAWCCYHILGKEVSPTHSNSKWGLSLISQSHQLYSSVL